MIRLMNDHRLGVLARLLCAILLGMSLAVFARASSSAAEPSERIDLPVFQHRLSNGDIRFYVRVRVGGGAPINAMLDTGSFGLRVLARALAPTQYAPTAINRGYGYGSGVVLHGPLAQARITVGDAAIAAPISIQVVESVDCNARKPNCPAARLAPSDYGIGGDGLPREGFDAIMGISLRESDAPGAAINPLVALGKRWIVILPKPDERAPGRLIVNPSADDSARFNPAGVHPLPPLRDGRKQVMDAAIPSCPDAPLDRQASCAMMSLDSGARPGVPPFYQYAVLYDAEQATVAVRAR